MKEGNWYSSTVCNLSLDHYLNGPAVPLGAALNEEDAVRLVKSLGVDMVQHWSQHHDGKAVYPTKFSQSHSNVDLLDFWSKVARKAGVRFCIYYSSLVNRIAAEQHPDWTQRKSDGAQYTRWNFGQMCTNSPYIDQYLIPQIEEMIDGYNPDAFWFDGDSWAVHPCWCDNCKLAYNRDKGREFPRGHNTADLLEVSEFARSSFENYHGKLVSLMRKRNPQIQFCSNWAYSLRQPDEVPEHIGWLSGDVLPSGGLGQISLESRFLTNRGKPFDIMTWDQSVVLDKNGAWLTIAQKPLAHMLQEGSLILAQGGRWFMWHSLLWDGWMSHAAKKKLEASVSFARKRARLCLNTVSVPDIAVLHSQTSLHLSNLQDAIPNIRDSDDCLPGARNFLVKARRHFDILNEDKLIEKLPKYRLLIVPEQAGVPQKVADSIRAYVQDGGVVVCVENGMWAEKALPDLFKADPIQPVPSTLFDKVEPIEKNTGILSMLVDVFGVELEGVHWTRAGFLPQKDNGEAQPVFCYWYNVKLDGAKILTPLWNHHDQRRNSLKAPSSTIHRFGKGSAIYIPAPIFSAFGHLRYPFLGEWFENILDRVAPPVLRIKGEGEIEITWRKRGRVQYVHLVNISTRQDLIRGNVFMDTVPPLGPFSLELEMDRKPSKIMLNPITRGFKQRYSSGRVTATIPKIEYMSTLIVES